MYKYAKNVFHLWIYLHRFLWLKPSEVWADFYFSDHLADIDLGLSSSSALQTFILRYVSHRIKSSASIKDVWTKAELWKLSFDNFFFPVTASASFQRGELPYVCSLILIASRDSMHDVKNANTTRTDLCAVIILVKLNINGSKLPSVKCVLGAICGASSLFLTTFTPAMSRSLKRCGPRSRHGNTWTGELNDLFTLGKASSSCDLGEMIDAISDGWCCVLFCLVSTLIRGQRSHLCRW